MKDCEIQMKDREIQIKYEIQMKAKFSMYIASYLAIAIHDHIGI